MNEQIGHVLLILDDYHQKDQYSDGDETENGLLEAVSNYTEAKYPQIIAGKASWPYLYHLSPIRENIVTWYPFREGATLLELGSGCGAVTGAFLKKGLNVTSVDLSLRRSRINATRHQGYDNLKIHVGAMEDIMEHFTEPFDYVSLIGVLEYAAVFSKSETPFRDVLQKAADVMKDNGILLVAIENKLGLKYFAGCREDHTGRYFESIEGYPHQDGPRTFSRKELAEIGEECGFECRFYYPYPDYKFPIKVFSDEYLPQKGELSRNWQNFDAERIQLFDEQKAFDSIIEAGLFPELSNSFLVEMRKEKKH